MKEFGKKAKEVSAVIFGTFLFSGCGYKNMTDAANDTSNTVNDILNNGGGETVKTVFFRNAEAFFYNYRPLVIVICLVSVLIGAICLLIVKESRTFRKNVITMCIVVIVVAIGLVYGLGFWLRAANNR